MRIARQIVRGCGALPHVGSHPGTGYVLALIGAGAVAGREGGWAGALVGAGIVAAFMVPMYLYGAFARAELSDRIGRQKS